MSDQPMPTPGQSDVTESLIDWLRERQAYGRQKYGQSLMTFDSRRNLSDLRDELLDALQYVHKEIMERAAIEAEVKALNGRTCETCAHWDGPRGEEGRKANIEEYGGDATGPFLCGGLDYGDNVADDVWTVATFGCRNWEAVTSE